MSTAKQRWHIELEAIDMPTRFKNEDDFLTRRDIIAELREFARTATIGVRYVIRKVERLEGK